jgi:serine/threonine-protein kinase
MAEENEKTYCAIAVEKGYLTEAQSQDGLQTYDDVRTLGLEETIRSILVKKQFLTEEQSQEVARIQAQRSQIKIPGYEIIEKVGQGGMGAVFKARQVSLDRVVALKILSPRLAEDQEFCERFIREAQSVAKLNHPNIIVGIDVRRYGKYFYFAMEFVDGDTALRILKKSGPFSEARALKVAVQVARALEHAHRNGLVHRDIKPDNIMLTARDEAKLCDLGLAKKVDVEAGSRLTGTAMGTPHYISPEQARGESNVTIASDLYSLGASLYHMTTGQTLFKGASSQEIMLQHLTAEAPNAKKLRPELSDNFCRILEKLLAKSPQDRHANPTELLADLERAQRGRPPKAALAETAASSMARLRPRRGLVTTGPQATVRGTDAREPVGRPDAATGPKSAIGSRQNLIIGAAAGGCLLLGALIWILVAVLGGGNGPNGPGTEVASTVSRPPDSTKTDPSPSSSRLLEELRARRDRNPEDFQGLIEVYRQAELGEPPPPPAVLVLLQNERKELETRQWEVFRKYLDGLQPRLQSLKEQAQYGQAMELLSESSCPPGLRGPRQRAALAEQRQQLNMEMMRVFREVEAELTSAFRDAKNDLEKLKGLRERIAGQMKVYSLDPAKSRLGDLNVKLNQRLEELEKRDLRLRMEMLFAVVTEAQASAEAGELVKAMNLLDHFAAEGQAAQLPQLDRLREDLRIYQADLRKEGALPTATPAERMAAGRFHFWRGRFGQAAELLTTLKQDETEGAHAALYLAHLEYQAERLMERTRAIYRDAQQPGYSNLERIRRQREARKLVERLKREFVNTEVYRAQSKT